MQHKKHISNIIKFGIAGLILCLLILGYAFLLNLKTSYSNATIQNEGKFGKFIPIQNNLYKNDRYGVQLIVPDNWVENIIDNKVMDFGIMDSSFGTEYPVYVVGRYSIRRDLSEIGFDKIVDASKDRYLESVEKGTFLSDEKITINGLEARLFKIRADKYNTSNELETVIDYELFINTGVNNGLFVFLGGYRESLGELYDKKILDIFNSIKIIPKKDIVYVNKKIGFQITIPPTWTQGPEEYEYMFKLIDPYVADNFYVINGTYFNKDEMEGVSFEDTCKNYVNTLVDAFNEHSIGEVPKLISNEKKVIDGLDICFIKTKTDIVDNAGKTQRYIDNHLLVNNGEKGVIVIMGSSLDSLPPEYEKTVINSLLSFKLLK